MEMRVVCTSINFYPRSPCGERRYVRSVRKGTTGNFYPRSPCGERLGAPVDKMPSSSISIHALLAESDRAEPPTAGPAAISIHALLAESDNLSYYFRKYLFLISIHALLAESDVLGAVTSPAVIKFLSTLSLRRATRSF